MTSYQRPWAEGEMGGDLILFWQPQVLSLSQRLGSDSVYFMCESYKHVPITAFGHLVGETTKAQLNLKFVTYRLFFSC